ncbi:phage prohead protease, HK97 family [Marinobacter segnicrescens]|uniref:Phage prohead protease, HK97 family n=1 Tax=Marinobacter segnicrescens TaxID=430453 RepID=A0A1I0H7R5_9GAMM|nr:HK97 family phage prohead protease [Marinobacter segnicrescens]SET79748.1 phage prohead protease, HK97 family [Marinobacter segnicrescens]
MSPDKRYTGFIETRAESDGEGIFSGYVVTWNTTDSHNTAFQRGAFKKTISERAGKIKLLWNHKFEDMPIGKILELREDDKGLYFRAQLALGIERARDAFELMKIGELNMMSFGFKIIKDAGFKNGVRQITEVQLMEISPVNFASGPEADIDPNSVRATDFKKTIDENDLRTGGRRILSAFDETVWDIWWDSESTDELMRNMDQAWGDAHNAYMVWLDQLIESEPELRGNPEANELATAFEKVMEGRSALDFAADSTLTRAQVEDLRRGKMIDEAAAQALPDQVRGAHDALKAQTAEDLIEQISGLSVELRSKVLDAFVKPAPESQKDEPEFDEAIMAELRNTLNQFKTR